MTTVALEKCPKTGKRSFGNEEAAVQFEESNRAQYGHLKQFAYACEECPNWHLTSTPRGNNTVAQVRYEPGVSVKKGLDTETVLRHKAEGWSVQQIADEYHVSKAAVEYHLKKSEKAAAAGKVGRPANLVTYEQYNARRVELEAGLVKLCQENREAEERAQQEINRVKSIEDRLFEAKQLKIGYGADGAIILRKYDREFDLTKDEFAKLLAEVSGPANSSDEQVLSPA